MFSINSSASRFRCSLEGGTTFVQLREKELDEAHFLKEAKEIKELCARYRVPFVINDNVDIALEMDADGVYRNCSLAYFQQDIR